MEKITHINSVIQEYFELNQSVSKIPAKDLMPIFIRSGIFSKDEKNGLPIRNILRQLDRTKQLSKIPSVIAERKQKNTNWFFGRTKIDVMLDTNKHVATKTVLKSMEGSTRRKESDEHYIIDICDDLIGMKGCRQHKFPFLVGDAGTMLPIDVFYESKKLVIEFNEQQHTKEVKLFDKPNKLTVSGVHRGEQRKLYDQRKRAVLPERGITVLDISYNSFTCDQKGKIIRNREVDLIRVKHILKNHLK